MNEEAIYVVEGSILINGTNVSAYRMAVLPDQASIMVESQQQSRIVILGGEPIGKRYLWWNFVASNRESLREAAKLWAAGGFDRVEGDEEFIPLPENRPIP